MLSLKLGIIGYDNVKNKPFYSEIEHETRSMNFFFKQEISDIFSYYEYCGFHVKAIFYTRTTKYHKYTSMYYREEIPYAYV